MSRGVSCWLFGSVAVVALVALGGCGHYFFAEREPWRHDAEVACLNSGAVRETPGRVHVSAIEGPGVCGADFPIRVSAFGDSAPLGYDDEPVRPPGAVPDGALPPRWPGAQPPPYSPPPPYAPPPPAPYVSRSPDRAPMRTGAPSGPPLSLTPEGLAPPPGPPPSYPPAAEEGEAEALPPDIPHPYPPGVASGSSNPPPTFAQSPYQRSAQPPPGEPPPQPPPVYPPPFGGEGRIGPVGPVAVTPVATLACPIVSALDQWVATAVQPAALHWFRQPVVGIKQISAYSCRGMNGNPNAHISEHAFGNALDIAEFDLADGHRVSVQHGWHGAPEEQGFLRDVQAAACAQFTTVLAPGANVYHYNHIHVDLMRRAGGRRVCEPGAISGEVVAARARAHYAAQHPSDPGVTGSIKSKVRHFLGYSGEDDDHLPLAEPGDD
jgi:hypothetical protein